MRTRCLVVVSLTVAVLAACVAGKKGSTDDDDDSSTTTGTGTTTATGTTTTTSQTTSGTGTTTTTSQTTTTTTSTATASCYSGHGDCDPMQNDCPTAGAACDIDADSLQFVCFDPPNNAGSGQPCDVSSGPYCMNGLTCVNNGTSNLCVAYCCSEADCGAGPCESLGMSGTIEVKVCTGG